MVIRGGTVATASDTVKCDVGIRGGRVVALGLDLGGATEVVDATGKLVLPGGIDSHVHLAQPSGAGIVMADDFESGTRSAAFGGNTLVMPFCMQEKGQIAARRAQRLSQEGRGQVLRRHQLPPRDFGPDAAGAGAGAAGGGRRRLHLVQGVHDLRRPGADRSSDAGGVLGRARDRRPRHGARRELRRHPLPHHPSRSRAQARTEVSRHFAAYSRRARGDAPRDQRWPK